MTPKSYLGVYMTWKTTQTVIPTTKSSRSVAETDTLWHPKRLVEDHVTHPTKGAWPGNHQTMTAARVTIVVVGEKGVGEARGGGGVVGGGGRDMRRASHGATGVSVATDASQVALRRHRAAPPPLPPPGHHHHATISISHPRMGDGAGLHWRHSY